MNKKAIILSASLAAASCDYYANPPHGSATDPSADFDGRLVIPEVDNTLAGIMITMSVPRSEAECIQNSVRSLLSAMAQSKISPGSFAGISVDRINEQLELIANNLEENVTNTQHPGYRCEFENVRRNVGRFCNAVLNDSIRMTQEQIERLDTNNDKVISLEEAGIDASWGLTEHGLEPIGNSQPMPLRSLFASHYDHSTAGESARRIVSLDTNRDGIISDSDDTDQNGIINNLDRQLFARMDRDFAEIYGDEYDRTNITLNDIIFFFQNNGLLGPENHEEYYANLRRLGIEIASRSEAVSENLQLLDREPIGVTTESHDVESTMGNARVGVGVGVPFVIGVPSIIGLGTSNGARSETVHDGTTTQSIDWSQRFERFKEYLVETELGKAVKVIEFTTNDGYRILFLDSSPSEVEYHFERIIELVENGETTVIERLDSIQSRVESRLQSTSGRVIILSPDKSTALVLQNGEFVRMCDLNELQNSPGNACTSTEPTHISSALREAYEGFVNATSTMSHCLAIRNQLRTADFATSDLDRANELLDRVVIN